MQGILQEGLVQVLYFEQQTVLCQKQHFNTPLTSPYNTYCVLYSIFRCVCVHICVHVFVSCVDGPEYAWLPACVWLIKTTPTPLVAVDLWLLHFRLRSFSWQIIPVKTIVIQFVTLLLFWIFIRKLIQFDTRRLCLFPQGQWGQASSRFMSSTS